MSQVLDQLSRRQYVLALTMFFFLIFMGSLPTMSAFYILGDLGGGVATASYGMTLFTLGSVLTKPFGIILSDNFGHLRSIKLCAWAMFLSFIPTLWVQNYYPYLFFRFLNGFLSGPMFLLIMRLCAEHMSKEKVEKFIHVYLVLMITVPVIGAVFGGVISYGGFWQMAFWITAIVFFGVCTLFHVLFYRMEAQSTPHPIDWTGWVLFLFALMLLGFCLITGEVIDGFRSIAFNIIFTVGCAFSLLYILWSVIKPKALLNWCLFKNSDFSLVMFNTFWIVSFHFASLILLSYWLHLFVNYSVRWVAFIGAFVFLGTLGVVIAVRTIALGKGLWVTFSALSIMGGTAYFVSRFNSEVNLTRIILAHTLMGMAYALYFPRIVYRLRELAKKEELLSAFCMFACVRSLATVFGIAYFTTLWDRRFVFYYTRLGGTLNQASSPLQSTLRLLKNFNFSGSMQLEGLNNALSRQASSLALADCFRLICWIVVGLFILTFIYKVIKGLHQPTVHLSNIKN